MKAFILAAGQGTRLGPYTKQRPKALIPLGGKPLLVYTLQNISKLGIADVSILTGYCANQFSSYATNLIHNENFANTNMVTTLFCAEKDMTEEFIISYGDIVYENQILYRLLSEAEDEISVIVDDQWLKLWKLRFNDPILEAETLKFKEGNYIAEIGAIPCSMQEIQSQYIGLIKVGKKALEPFKNLYQELKSLPPNQEIIRKRHFSQIYMTDFLQILIDRGVRVKGIRIQGGWLEIDSVRDYETYQSMFEQGSLNEYLNLKSIE